MKKFLGFLVLLLIFSLTISLGVDCNDATIKEPEKETSTQTKIIEPNFVAFLEDFIYV